MRTLANRKKKDAGFTLIEIMIVVLIIAVLLAIAIPNFLRARETSRAKSCTANLRQIETAKEQWAMDNKKGIADAAADPGELCPDYIRGVFPECPSAGVYTIGVLADRPVCSIDVQNGYDDHVLK